MKKSGYLKISFGQVRASTHSSGSRCDVSTPCDAFISIFVGGDEVLRTSTIWDNEYPQFWETYYSSKISKNSPITIQMWDFDTFSSNDLILSWDTSIEELLSDGEAHVKYGYGNSNKITTKTTWTEEVIILDD